MSGHSHWATIKHKKAKEDAKRGKAFTKLIKEITVAARLGGGDQAANPRLRLLLEKAKEINMPLENTSRAIKKGTGELPGVNYESFTYEGYGPFGIAVLVDTLSDNKNRTVAELRHLFSAKGGNLAETGAVSWLFEQMGVLQVPGSFSQDELLEKLIEYDIQDIKCEDGELCSIFCPVKSLESVKNGVLKAGLPLEEAKVEWVAKSSVNLSDQEAEKAYDFLTALDDHDDVQQVYTNLA